MAWPRRCVWGADIQPPSGIGQERMGERLWILVARPGFTSLFDRCSVNLSLQNGIYLSLWEISEMAWIKASDWLRLSDWKKSIHLVRHLLLFADSWATTIANHSSSFLLFTRIFESSSCVWNTDSISDSKIGAAAKIRFSWHHASAKRRKVLEADGKKDFHPQRRCKIKYLKWDVKSTPCHIQSVQGLVYA